MLMSPDFKYGISHEHGKFKHVRLMDVDLEKFNDEDNTKDDRLQ